MTALTFKSIAGVFLAATLASFAAAEETFAVFKSNDRGQSWTRSDAGMPRRSRINAFGSSGEVLFAGTDSGIFTTRDKALTWQPATGAAMASGRIISFAALGQSVFAGIDGKGLLVSPDGGASWASERKYPSEKVRCLLALDGKIYAGTEASGVFVTTGVGQPWTQLAAGLPSYAQVFALSAVKGRLFAGLYSRGLYAWDELKRVWVKTGLLTPLALASVQETLIAGHNPGGLYWSGDWGASWSKGGAEGHASGPLVPLPSEGSGELSSEAAVWELGSGHGLVFAGASAGIYYSEDRGRTWKRARRGLPENSPGIAFLVTPDAILAGTLLTRRDGEH